jgi:hypothetical protein
VYPIWNSDLDPKGQNGPQKEISCFWDAMLSLSKVRALFGAWRCCRKEKKKNFFTAGQYLDAASESESGPASELISKTVCNKKLKLNC